MHPTELISKAVNQQQVHPMWPMHSQKPVQSVQCSHYNQYNFLGSLDVLALQSLTKYVKTNFRNQIKLNFYKKFNSWFGSFFVCYYNIFNFSNTPGIDYAYARFCNFLEIFSFPKILSLNLFQATCTVDLWWW